MRILIIDHSAPLRERLHAMLREAGVGEVIEATDAESALRLVWRVAVDAVLFDLPVGAASSLTFVRQARARLPRLIAVALTNEATETHRREWLTRGADFVFDKSRQFEQAVHTITRKGSGAHA